MTVGLGSGTTAAEAITEMGRCVANGLAITAVASSLASEKLAKEAGIQVVDITTLNLIDIAIDGADEVDKSGNLIKGGGGALTREKILAANSRKFVVIVDETKLVKQLGRFPVAVEVVPFAANFTLMQLQHLGCSAMLRRQNNQLFLTDNGNYIADCRFPVIGQPAKLNAAINGIAGVVESGLFAATMVATIMVGYNNGTAGVWDRH